MLFAGASLQKQVFDMADFVAVLKKTIDGLGDNTPELRQKVYEKARATIAAKIAAITPAPPALVVERQNKALEDAIAVVESSYAAPDATPDDDFDDILASLETPRAPQPAVSPTVSAPEPAMDEQVPAEDEAHTENEVWPKDNRESQVWTQADEPVAPSFGDHAPEASQPDAAVPEPLPAPDGDDGRDHSFRTGANDPAAELSPVSAAPRAEPALAGSPPRKRRSVPTGAIAGVLLLLVLAGAAYGVWLNRGEFADLLGMSDRQVAAGDPQDQSVDSAASGPATDDSDAPAQPAGSQTAGGADPVEKFTQRLTESGEETDPGPAGGERRIGEGT